MAARRTREATKRKNNDKVELETSVEIKEECKESIYFKMDCNNTLRTHLSKKTKLGLKQVGKADGSSTRLDRSFYDQPAEDLAKKLLGKLLYRVLDNGEVSFGRIVETEAYLGEVDKACHSYGGRRIGRCEPLYMAPGTAYVYVIYGMYHCLNVSSQEPGACVLIRALEPLQGKFIWRSTGGWSAEFRMGQSNSNALYTIEGFFLSRPSLPEGIARWSRQ